MRGLPSLSPLPLERERARVRGNLISFPLPLILGAKLESLITGKKSPGKINQKLDWFRSISCL
jgi:hypothetical protein